MNALAYRRDLVVLTADKDAETALRTVLRRTEALGVREIDAEFFVHPERDPGVLARADDFLRPFLRSHQYALVMLDREGCGRERRTPEELQRAIETALEKSGWRQRATAIVVDPELEAWVWADSRHVAEALGWPDFGELRRFLQSKGFTPVTGKPAKPKEAMEAALRQVRRPRSSSIYAEIAEKVSLLRCHDAAFRRLRDALRQWFHRGNAPPGCSAGTGSDL